MTWKVSLMNQVTVLIIRKHFHIYFRVCVPLQMTTDMSIFRVWNALLIFPHVLITLSPEQTMIKSQIL